MKNAFKDGGMYSKAKGGKKDLQPEQALDVYLDIQRRAWALKEADRHLEERKSHWRLIV